MPGVEEPQRAVPVVWPPKRFLGDDGIPKVTEGHVDPLGVDSVFSWICGWAEGSERRTPGYSPGWFPAGCIWSCPGSWLKVTGGG
jgi:hypothetical protein